MKLVFTFLISIVITTSLLAQEESLMFNNIVFRDAIKTKNHVLSNEINFKAGDRVEESQIDSILESNASKLYNLQLFHWVKYKYSIEAFNVNVEFIVQERWFLWPIPIFSLADRNASAWFQKMDFNRIDYGIHLIHENFRGRNEKLKSNIQLGYNQKYEVFYTIPYIDKQHKFGLDFGVSHYRSQFTEFDLVSNKPVFDEFPTGYAIQESYARAGVFRRKGVDNIYNFNIEGHSLNINDSILIYNPNYLEKKKLNFLKFNISHIINSRQTFSYPTKGYYLSYGFSQRVGLNSKNINITDVNVEGAFYIPINKRLFFSTGLSANYKYSINNYFFDAQELGYKKYVRGYEYYAINGNAMVLQKNGFNLAVFENKMINLSFIKSKKFNTIPISVYFSLYADAGYVNDSYPNSNNLYANDFLFGSGLGLHIVTYYDRVLVLEYSFNKLGQNGFFISTKFPI